MSTPPDPAAITSAALQAIVDELRAQFAVQRVTLRLEGTDPPYAVAHESRAEGVRTLIGDTTVPLKGQPVVEAMLAGEPQVVQDDCATANEDPAFQKMLGLYGGMAAQIVTAVRADGRLKGIVSLHQLQTPRTWTQAEKDAASAACRLLGRIL
jgi:GAF domain-containing protein